MIGTGNAMNPFEWLKAHAYGYDSLSSAEHDALSQFLFLWSLFEAEVLNTRGSPDKIICVAKHWEAKDKLNIETFQSCLSYFQKRYVANGDVTPYFQNLALRDADKPLVRAVMSGEEMTPADIVAALLLIVYRLRNNFFHGAKWADGIHDQLDNFCHANTLLMTVMDLGRQP